MTEYSAIEIYSSTPPEAATPKISFRRMLQLALKTWPFIRPMLLHVIVLMIIGFISGIIFTAATFLLGDLFNNKVLVGEKLQPFQASVLRLDDTYVKEGYTSWSTDPDPLIDPEIEGVAKDAVVENIVEDGLISVLATLFGGEVKGTAADKAATEDTVQPGAKVDKPRLLTEAQRKTVRNRMMILLALMYAFSAILFAIVPYYARWVWQSVNQHLRVAMIERMEHLSLRYHSNTRVGDAIFRVYQDSAMIINLLDKGIVGPAVILYELAIGLMFITFFDPRVAFACFLVLLPILWLAWWFTPRLRRRSLANRLANSNLTSRLQETFSAIKVVKVNRAEGKILDRFDTDSQGALDAALYLRLEMVVLNLLAVLIGGLTLVGLEYIMVTWVIDEQETYLGAAVAAFIGFTVWNLGAFESANGRVQGSLGMGRQLVRIWSRLQDLFIGLERAFFLLDLTPEVVDPVHPHDFPETIREIAWRDVHFAYSDRPVLRGVDLTARVDTITAIVGATGSGKSTLMSMLLRLYDPDVGHVLINDIDLQDLRIDDIRQHSAIALQRNVLFAASVEDNIRYAALNASHADVEAAARVACADTFIQELPRGYDTELGERGGKLSTGQRQRLSIARAIVRNTPILILDEPTASLDAGTEHQVLQNLLAWGEDRVVFIITHRLSTIRNADQIAFLEQGRIVETGSHDELMSLPAGRYRGFVEAETTGAIAS